VPFGLNRAVWVDDEAFDIDHHVRRTEHEDLTELADVVMSTPLCRDRPLWELWIADRLDAGGVGVVGKAHHCMVDGIAAVEMAALLLDPTPDPPKAGPDGWTPSPPPGRGALFAEGLRDRVLEELDLLRTPVRIMRSPKHLIGAAADARKAALALAHSFSGPAPRSVFNPPSSPLRHLAVAQRPLADLKRVKSRFGTTVNDVVLAASSGAVRRFLQQRGEVPVRLKTMVPVNLRENGSEEEFGNNISFLFVELPCDEPDPIRRLLDIHMTMSERKRSGEPKGGQAVLKAVSYAPHQVQRLVSKLVSSPRTFNLVVSNIPGPREPLYMRGCELQEAYPVVPLAERHAVSIGVTTIKDGAFFGVYADRESLPDAELLARDIDAAVEELIALT
jgi:WS/DGAT/MGAT family acyltransferase